MRLSAVRDAQPAWEFAEDAAELSAYNSQRATSSLLVLHSQSAAEQMSRLGRSLLPKCVPVDRVRMYTKWRRL
jgi:hypothetical protein